MGFNRTKSTTDSAPGCQLRNFRAAFRSAALSGSFRTVNGSSRRFSTIALRASQISSAQRKVSGVENRQSSIRNLTACSRSIQPSRARPASPAPVGALSSMWPMLEGCISLLKPDIVKSLHFLCSSAQSTIFIGIKENTMNSVPRLLSPAHVMLAAMTAVGALAQMSQPLVGENTTKISDHVWAIMGFPNIAIVVGNRSTLVVDTGMGSKNGATVARVAARLAPGNQKLFLTTTHFHPEHAAGEPGFPPGTILIRNTLQQQEMEKHGEEMMEMFRGFSSKSKELLDGVRLRPPDVTFDHDATVDLGGVTARLLWLGEAHTKGDELTFVEPRS